MVETMMAEEHVGMPEAGGWPVAITGAAGFIRRTALDRIERGAPGAIAELRLNDLPAFEHRNTEFVLGGWTGGGVRDRLSVAAPTSCITWPRCREARPIASPAPGKTVNLDGSMASLEAVAGAEAPVVVLSVAHGEVTTDHPPLDASGALAVGFRSDGDVGSLVDAVVSRLERQRAPVADGSVAT